MENKILDRLLDFEFEKPNTNKKYIVPFNKKLDNKMRYYAKASLLDRALILEKAEKFENTWAIDSLARIEKKLLNAQKDIDSVMWFGYTSNIRGKLNDTISFLVQLELIKDRLKE